MIEEVNNKKLKENIIKVEEDPYIKDIKRIQNKEANVQPILKRPDSAKYLPIQKPDLKQNNIPNNNQIKPNHQPVIKSNLPISNNNVNQKQQINVQNNVNSW